MIKSGLIPRSSVLSDGSNSPMLLSSHTESVIACALALSLPTENCTLST